MERADYREVIYDEERWRLLREKRRTAKTIMETLIRCGFTQLVVHGSIARGDVEPDSDIDVALLAPTSIGLVELCLERGGFSIHSMVLVQPTPIHTPKVYIYLDPFEEKVVTVPLVELKPIEKEFYRFSGCLTYEDLVKDVRVPGVNKRLVLIEPTPRGHIEIPVIGNEGFVARRLGVSIEVVRDRVEALTRRREEGHTGLFIEIEIPPGRTIEEVVEELCRENKLFRQAVARYGLCL